MRDVVVIGGCFVREWSSLRAFWLVLRNWRSAFAKRRANYAAPAGNGPVHGRMVLETPVSYPGPQTLRAGFEEAASV